MNLIIFPNLQNSLPYYFPSAVPGKWRNGSRGSKYKALSRMFDVEKWGGCQMEKQLFHFFLRIEKQFVFMWMDMICQVGNIGDTGEKVRELQQARGDRM